MTQGTRRCRLISLLLSLISLCCSLSLCFSVSLLLSLLLSLSAALSAALSLCCSLSAALSLLLSLLSALSAAVSTVSLLLSLMSPSATSSPASTTRRFRNEVRPTTRNGVSRSSSDLEIPLDPSGSAQMQLECDHYYFLSEGLLLAPAVSPYSVRRSSLLPSDTPLVNLFLIGPFPDLPLV